MGWRFFRRIKLFGGLGLNLSKKGISASIRTPFGSVNSRGGYSIRTPIPGLSYRGSGIKLRKLPKPANKK